jgi:hypothetical protein
MIIILNREFAHLMKIKAANIAIFFKIKAVAVNL